MTDTVPVVSQVKSILQLLFGQTTQALETQVNFVDATPLLSQLKSIYEILVSKDLPKAIETQKKFLIITNATIDGIPLIGHIKGLGHYIIGDFQNGNNSMKRSSRTTVVILCGYFACTIIVPTTATLETTCAISSIGSMIGGLSMDTLITLIENVIKKDGSLHGHYNTFNNILKNPFDIGSLFDAIMGPILDGLIGAIIGFKIWEYRNPPHLRPPPPPPPHDPNHPYPPPPPPHDPNVHPLPPPPHPPHDPNIHPLPPPHDPLHPPPHYPPHPPPPHGHPHYPPPPPPHGHPPPPPHPHYPPPHPHLPPPPVPHGHPHIPHPVPPHMYRYPTPLKMPLPPPPPVPINVGITSVRTLHHIGHLPPPPLPLPRPFNPFEPHNMHLMGSGLKYGTAAAVLQRHAKHN
eukprot:354571_1